MFYYIYHHLGLGDHFICNGLVREIVKSKPDDQFVLLCKDRNYVTVSAMYKDLDSLYVQSLPTEKADLIAKDLVSEKDYKIGHEKLIHYMRKNSCFFDEAFYLQMNVPFEKRWESFKISRDPIQEDILFQVFGVHKDENYAFIHDDPVRGFMISEKYIGNIKTVHPVLGITNNMLHYAKIIENASSIHCIDSSFRCFLETLPLKATELTFHIYARDTATLLPRSKLNWTILY